MSGPTDDRPAVVVRYDRWDPAGLRRSRGGWPRHAVAGPVTIGSLESIHIGET